METYLLAHACYTGCFEVIKHSNWQWENIDYTYKNRLGQSLFWLFENSSTNAWGLPQRGEEREKIFFFLRQKMIENDLKKPGNKSLAPVIDMFKKRGLIVEKIDGSKEYVGGTINNIYYDGMNKMSCKLVKLYLERKTSSPDKLSSNDILNLIKKTNMKSIRTKI